jgi:ribosome-associated protein
MEIELLYHELKFSAVRSGGPGGQHANKVSSKVIVQFDIENSKALSEGEKTRLLDKLSTKLNKKNQISLTCDESRSQYKNKQIVTERLLTLFESALKEDKKRIPTKVGKLEKARRLEAKKKRGLKKSLRKKPKLDL